MIKNMNEASKDCKFCLGTGLVEEVACPCRKDGDPDRNYVVQDPDLK